MKHLLLRISVPVFAFLTFFLSPESYAQQQSLQEVKETLDSITTPFTKEYFGYDASGNNTLTTTKIKDGMTSQWLYEYKSEAAYNVAGKITSFTRYKWNSGSQNWRKEFEYSYTATGKVTSYTSYKWNSASPNGLINFKEEYSYNENGKRLAFKQYTQPADTTKEAILTTSEVSIYNDKGLLTYSLATSFDAAGKKSYRKNTVNYDAKTNITSEIQQIAQEDSIWKQDFKIVYLYSNENKLVNKTIYSFNEMKNQWLVFVQTTLKYDASGKETERVDSVVNYDQNVVKLYKESKGYNGAGKEISRVLSFKELTTNNWGFTSKFETNYDNLNQLQSYLSYRWVDSVKNWVKISKREVTRSTENDILSEFMYVLDTNQQWTGLWKLESKRGNGLYENTAIPLSLIDSSLHRINSRLHYSWSLGNWNLQMEAVYHYSERTVTGLTSSSSDLKTFTISPNPAKEYFSVLNETLKESLRIELTDMQGQKVLSQDLKINTSVSVSHLKKGMYVYHLSDATGTTSGKLLVE